MRSSRSVAGAVMGATLAVAMVTSGVMLAAGSTSSASVTKTRARTIAKHVNLRAADFPGYKVHPYQASKSGKAAAKQTAKCVGLASPLVTVNSAAYDNGHGAIYSSVAEFVSTRTAAKRDVRRAVSARARHCLRQEFAALADQVGATDAHVTLTPVSQSPIAGLDAIYGMKYTVTFTVFGFHETLHGWTVEFSRGNAEVTLNEVGTANVPASNLTAPLSTLAHRARHHVPARGLRVTS